MLVRRALQLQKQPVALARPFSSEFKRFFGFEDHLEDTKVKNDKNLHFETKKQSNIMIFITGIALGTLFYTLVSGKRREQLWLKMNTSYIYLRLSTTSDVRLSQISWRLTALQTLVRSRPSLATKEFCLKKVVKAMLRLHTHQTWLVEKDPNKFGEMLAQA